MLHAWYESFRDGKDHIYFEKTEILQERRPHTPFPHFHHSIEIAFGLKGSIPITVSGEEYLLNEGEICFINSMEPHKYRYSIGQKCYVILISSSFFNEINKLGNISFATHMKRNDGFAVIQKYLDYAIETWDEDSLLCKRAFADELAYLLMRYYEVLPKKEMERHSAALLGAVQYICEHYTEKLTVADVARRFGYSANYFSSAFNEFIGMSFPDYLNACRMLQFDRIQRANPALPTCKVAKMCGFGSMNTFYRTKENFADDVGFIEQRGQMI